MRFLILAAALALAASPALAQVRQEFLQRAEQESIPDQTRFGRVYDVGQDLPQSDTDARAKRLLIGAGIGFTVGFGFGWLQDESRLNVACPVSHFDDWDCDGLWDRPYQFRITGSLLGMGIGATLGWFWPIGADPADQRPRRCGPRRCRFPR